jgi:hypothetical protein
MTYIGKIGRHSKTRRDQSGQRLEDGLPDTEIVHWLHGRVWAENLPP